MLSSRVINEASLTRIYGYNMAIGRRIILNQYETVIIVDPNAEEEVVERITNEVQELISSSGGVSDIVTRKYTPSRSNRSHAMSSGT